MAGLERADWLSPLWRRLLVVGVAIAIPVSAALVHDDLSLWWIGAVAVVVGELVATAFYPTTPPLFGRVVGTLAGAAAFVAVAADGRWRWFAALPVVVGLLVLRARGRGMKQPDAVTRDRTFVPFLFDEGDRLVDAHDVLWGSTREGGPREGLRAAHSHGTVAHGEWRCDKTCGRPPDVSLFTNHGRGTVVARFSNFSGEVERADDRRMTHGLALQLKAPGEAGFTMVMIDGSRFAATTREDFLDLLRWFGSSGLRKVTGFFGLVFTGRTSIRALWQMTTSRRVLSYAERTYHGVNAFYCRFDEADQPKGRPLVDRTPRTEVPVRYRVSPLPPDRPVPVSRAAVAVPSTRLDTELRTRLDGGVPVRFAVDLVLGQGRRGRNLTDDRVRDPTRGWRWRSPTLRLCTITLDRYVPTDDRADRLLFQPFDVPDGIRPSDDEILSARRTAYQTSYRRRCPLDESAAGPARQASS